MTRRAKHRQLRVNKTWMLAAAVYCASLVRNAMRFGPMLMYGQSNIARGPTMKLTSLNAALLLSCAMGLGLPAAAQISNSSMAAPTRKPAPAIDDPRPGTPGAAPGGTGPITPTSTAAVPLAPTAAAPSTTGMPVPTYRPDNLVPLSGDGAAADLRAAPVRTLQEAISLAYKTNPELLAARAQARSADYRYPAARAAYGPTLSASASYTFTRIRQEIIAGSFAGAQGWASDAQLVLNQPLWTFGRNAANEAGALATAQYQRDALRVTEAQVLNGVVTAYLSVLRDAESVTIARENLALLERQLEENEVRYQVRDITLTDLDQTRTRVELGQAQLLQAKGQLGISQKQFLHYIGAPPGDLAAPNLLEIDFDSLETAYAYAEANSGLVRAAQAREKISRATVKSVQAEYGPRVDLRGTASYGSNSPFNDQLRTTQLVGQVVLTQLLYDSNSRTARLRDAQEANEGDWRLLDSVYRQTREAIGSAWDSLASTRTSLAHYREAIAAAQRAYEGALIQQKTGDRSTLDVLDLARDLLTVRNNYNLTRTNEYLARSQLLAAAGLLEGPKILPELKAYDADAHFQQVKHGYDVPLLTSAFSGLDKLTIGSTASDRPSRDAGAEQRLDQSMPLPPAAAASAP